MTYHLVSSDMLIGKILRDSGSVEAGYINRVREWIGDMMRMIIGTKQLSHAYMDAKVCFHKVKIPKSLMTLTGVTYKGARLPFRQIETVPVWAREAAYQEVLVFDDEYEVPVPLKPNAYEDTWKTAVVINNSEWYSVEPGFIITSIKDDYIRIYFRTMPHDKAGNPLIPDNAKLHESMYWFVRHKLIGSGWLDPVYGRDDRMCYERYKEYHDEATSSMDFMTPDMDMSLAEQNSRFYPNEDGWDSFSTNISTDEIL
jgi:hypothetical protein